MKRALADIQNSMGIELVYPGKAPRSEILAKPAPALKLKTLNEELGLPQPLVPKHRFFWGENESILRFLLHKLNLANKIQLVYVDPPFGTNQVFHIDPQTGSKTISRPNGGVVGYEDTLQGADFLEFLRRRFILLYELIADTGLIFVHMGEGYGFHIKIILDEIFGAKNYITCISRIKSNPKNFSRKAPGNIKDMILVYAKTKKYIWNDIRIPHTEEDIKKLFPKIDPATGRRYTTHPLHAPGETQNGETGKPWRGMRPPPGRHWRYPPQVLDELDRKGLIEWSKTGVPRKKVYADEQTKKGKRLQDIWEFKDPQNPLYPTQKNIDLLKLIVEVGSKPEDLVLDAFAGSGTTLLAAAKLGRRALGIDNSEQALHAFLRRLKQEDYILKQGWEIISAQPQQSERENSIKELSGHSP